MNKVYLFAGLLVLFGCHTSTTEMRLSRVLQLPALDILLPDSLSRVHIGDIPESKPMLIVYFRPDCPHSKLEIRNILARIAELRDCQLFFLTSASFADIKVFVRNYQLDDYSPKILIGKDFEHLFVHAFSPTSVPFMAIYNKQKRLVKIYHGEVPVARLLAALHS
jgi:hypothetical protein